MKTIAKLGAMLGIVLGAFTATTNAHALANSGVVSGTMRFYQNQGNWCPTGVCVGNSRYPQTQFRTMQPVKNATVFLRTTSGTQLGYSTTDASGNYSIYYDTNASVSSVYVYWIPEEVGARFRLLTSSAYWNFMNTAAQSLTAGTNKTKNWGTADFGTSLATVNAVANIWDGVQRTYWDALALSSAMQNDFVDVKLYMDMQAECSSSCYKSAANGWIYLDNQGYFSPQERVMHELGHAASYLASPPVRSNYGAISTGCGYNGGGWDWETQQPDCSATEEGFATFVSTYALYYSSAPNVRTCLNSADDCYDGSATEYDIEGFDSTCVADGADSSWPLTTLGYLWDTIDPNDTVDYNFTDVIDAMGGFDVGFGNRDVNEQFRDDGVYVIDYANGRNVRDFYWNFRYRGPLLNTESVLNSNCGNL